MSSDCASLLATLLAAGASPDECWDSLVNGGSHPTDVFSSLHDLRKNSVGTILLAHRLLDEAKEAEDFPKLDWLTEALQACRIHPYSVECLSGGLEDQGWWRDRVDLPSDIQFPRPLVADARWPRPSFVGADFRDLANLELIFPYGVTFDRCHLPPHFLGGLSTPSLHLKTCSGLLDLQGLHVLSAPADVEPWGRFPPELILEGMPHLEGLCPDLPSLWNMIIRNCPLLQITHPVHVFDELVIEQMDWKELPNQLTVEINLTLSDCPFLKLPRRLFSTGDLTLKYLPSARHWPEDFHCEGNLMIGGCPELDIPADVLVGMSLSLEHRSLSDPLLPGRLIEGSLDLNECTGDSLPNGIRVLGSLRLVGLQIHSLASDLEFGNLVIVNCPQLRIPERLTVPGDFELMRGTLDTLAADLSVRGPFTGIRGCTGTMLPKGFRVKGELLLYDLPELETLPEDLEAEVLRVDFCPRLRIPESLIQRIKGRIHVHR